MATHKILLVLLISLSAVSCHKVAKEAQEKLEEKHQEDLKKQKGVPYNGEKITKNTYQSPYAKAILNKRLILSFEIPKGLRKMNSAEMQSTVQQGQNAIGKETKEKTLLGLKKGDNHNILVNKVRLPLTIKKHFEVIQEHYAGVANTYANMAIPFKVNHSTVTIDEMLFNKAVFTLYKDETKQNAIVYQSMWAQVIEGELITITSTAPDLLSSVLYQKTLQNATIR